MTTGLDQCIVEWWSLTSSLVALVPVSRVAAEAAQLNETVDSDEDTDGTFDDCVIFQVASEPHWRTNSGRGWKSTVKLSALSVDYDRAKAIATAIGDNWDNKSFSGSQAAITLARSIGLTPEQDLQSGIWDFTISFEMQHRSL